jgi:hypothetical protein
MKTKANILSIIAAAIGFAVGAVVGRGLLAPRPPQATPAPAPAVVVAEEPPVGEAAGEVLRRQIADLERSLAYRMEQISELQHAVARRDEQMAQRATSAVPVSAQAGGSETNRAGRRREGFESPFDRPRTEDPEAAAERQRRREEFQQRLTQLHNDRRAFLGAVDTARMTAEQRENHARLIEALDKANAFRERLMSGDRASLSEEERNAAFGAMREVGELYQQERRFLLEETGRAYGENGAQFADYIENVIENTSLMPGFGRGPRGGVPRGEGGPAPRTGAPE